MTQVLLVGLGGFVGAIMRFLMSLLLKNSSFMGVSLSTLFINLIGSLLIGVLLYWNVEKSPGDFFLFLGPGLLGGFTTYSAFSGEAFFYLKHSQLPQFFLYAGITVLGGLLATAVGYTLARVVSL